MASCQQQVAQYYNARVKTKIIQPDLVLQQVKISKPTEQGKLSPNWKGPYQISKVIQLGDYKLEELDGTAILKTWDEENLRMYYQLALGLVLFRYQ